LESPAEERRQVDSVTRNGIRLDLDEVATPSGSEYEIRNGGTLGGATYAVAWNAPLLEAVIPDGVRQKRLELLIRGLGSGEILRASVRHPAVKSVTVVEPESAIVRWNRRYLANQPLLEESGVEVVIGPFGDYIQGVPRSYDGIALDYTSSPADGRRELTLTTVARLRTRLRSMGTLAVLAPIPQGNGARAYEHVLEDAFGQVEGRQVEAVDRAGQKYESLLYTARNQDEAEL
jgi:spermidine synthase